MELTRRCGFLLAFVALLACGFDPKIPKEARQTCKTQSDCPSGFLCTPLPGKSVQVCCRNGNCDEISVDISPRDSGASAADAPATPTSDASAASDSPAPDAAAPDARAPTPDASPDADPCSGTSCPKGASRCGPGGGVQTCVAMGACTVWGNEVSCPSSQRCESGKCVCGAPPPGCEMGAGTTCESASRALTCTKDQNGCVTGAQRTDCPAGKPCAGAFPGASCSCPAPPAECMGRTGRFCTMAGELAECAADPQTSCVSIKSADCPNIRVCKGSYPDAGCRCPADNQGAACGSCGGTVQCDGSCSKPNPPNYGRPCGTCGGTIQCDGMCNRPEAPSCAEKACGADDGCGGKCRGPCPGGQVCSGSVDLPRCQASTGKLLVGASNGQSVKAYEAANGQSLGDFTTGGPTTSGASALALGGPQGNLFVKAWSSPLNAIVEYDGRTGAFVRTLVGGGAATPGSGMDFGPDGNLYAADTSGNIARWNVTSGALVGVFVTKADGGLESVGGLRWGPDGNLYVGSYSFVSNIHQVLRFDGSGTALGAFVAPGSGNLQAPRDLVFSRGGGSLFVVSENQVLRYDRNGAFVSAIDVANAAGLAFGSDSTLYVSVGVANEVRRYNPSTGALIDVFATGTNANPTYMLFAPP